MLSPTIGSPQNHSVTRITTPGRNLHSKAAQELLLLSAERSARRLFNGMGQSDLQANLLVQSGKKLYSEKELEDALISFTTAISVKDKNKANDLSHAEAYLGAGAVFDAQGKSEFSLHHYHEGSRKLNAIHPNSILLANSYVRLAILYERKGEYHFHKAAEFFKRALEIYKRNIDLNPYRAQTHQRLSELYKKMGQERVSLMHSKQANEIGRYSLDLFSSAKQSLSEIFDQITFPKKQNTCGEDSSRSVSTEPSPVREALLPSIHKECSPMKFLYINQQVGTSPVDKKSVNTNTEIPQTRVIGSSPIQIGQFKETSSSPMPTSLVNRSVGRSPLERKDEGTSPRLVPIEHKGIGTNSIQQKESECSPIRSHLVNRYTERSPLERKDEGTSPRLVPIEHKGMGTNSIQQKESGCSPIRSHLVNRYTERSPLERKDEGTSPRLVPIEHKGIGTNSIQQKDFSGSPIRITRNELSAVIQTLKNYNPDGRESGKIKSAQALLVRAENYAKGELSKPELKAYLDAYFDIENNPVFAGMFSRRLEAIFQEARKQLN